MTDRSRSAARLLAAALLLAAAPGLALAQETREHDFPSLDRELGVLDYVKVRFKMLNRFVGNTDFGSFDTSSNQPEARLRVTVPVARNAGIQLLGTGGVFLYDFDGVSDLFGTGPSSADPFDSLNYWTLRLQGAYLLGAERTLFSKDERWSLLLEGFGRARWEAGSEVSDGSTGGGSLAFGYKLGERLEIAAGVSVGTKLLGDGIRVSPLVELDWNINDRWTLRSYGLGFQLERKLSDRLMLFVRSRLETHSFRLGDRGGTIGKGTVRIRQLPAGLGCRWELNRHVRLTAVAGAVAYSQLRVKNQDRDGIGEETGDPAPYLSLRFDLRP